MRSTSTSLVQHEGMRAVLLIAFPPVITIGALVPRRKRPAVVIRSAAALLILSFATIGAASLGLFYLPSGVLMAIAAVQAARGRPL